MFSGLRAWLRPPILDNDAHDAKSALIIRMLNAILIGLIMSCVLFATAILIGSSTTRMLWLIILAVLAVFLIGLLAIMRYGYVSQASIFVIVVIYVIGTWGIFTVGTINEAVTAMYFILLLLATLLIDGRATLVGTGVVVVTLLGFMLAEQAGVMASERGFPPAGWAEWLTWSTIYLVCGGLLYLANFVIFGTLQKAQDTAAALRMSNRSLAEMQANLEDQIQARTQAAEQARREAEEAQQAMANNVWMSIGQAGLNYKLRGEQQIETLAQNVMRVICRYVEAPVGSLFLLHEERLQLAGGYAYAPANPPEFMLGEGLVGQAAVSKQPIHVQEIADSDLAIISGLGVKKPTDVYAFPLLFEEQVIGVMEIAHWRPLAARQEAFVQSVLESVAIAFHTAQSRQRINELLLVTQQQTEELQAQEEELRVTNEALTLQARTRRPEQPRRQDGS